MAVPILGRRRERRQAELIAAVEKAMSPMVAQAAAQSQAASGATYPVVQRGTSNPSDPFTQTGGYGGSFTPLPRGDSNFNSLFGPGYPLIPDPLDALGENGRALPRRTQYLVSANLQLIDRRIPWSVLKGIADDVDVVQRCIQIVQDAIVGLNWSWGFSSMILQQIMTETGITNTAKAGAYARDKYGDELARVQQFFEYPDRRMGFTFSQWMTDIIYSHLVYDGIVIYPQYNLGGELESLSTIDTSTIKILLDNQGFIPRPPAPAYQQILYGFPRGEFVAEDMDGDGKIPNGFQSDQIAYYIRRPHPSSIYGYSQVEECVNIATLYMQRQAWLHSEYTHGAVPRLFMETAESETWTPEQLAYYEQIMNDRLSGQTQRRQQLFMLRPGMKPTPMKQMDEMYKNTYDEWLISQIASKFGIPSGQLGIKAPASLGGGGSAIKGQADASEQFATDALRNFLIDCINDMARRFLGVGPELTITATGGGDEDDNVQRAQADASDVSSGIRTRNEIRAERGIPLVDEPEADQLGVTTGQGVSFLAGQFAQQQAQQAQQAQQSAPAAGSTPPEGEDGTDQSNADAGRQPVSGGDGASEGASGGDAGTAEANGASVTAQPAKKPAPESEQRAKVTPKDDSRQPEAQKELAAFHKFAKARAARGGWRSFVFESIGRVDADRLNAAGATGDLDVIKAAVSAPLVTAPSKAGIAVIALDSGRVFMRQRSLDHSHHPGKWEFPGGKLEPGETAPTGAAREWIEEVGVGIPDGELIGRWTSPDNSYEGFIWQVEAEDVLPAGTVAGNGDATAWFALEDLAGNPAVIDDIRSMSMHVFGVNTLKSLEIAEYGLHRYAKATGDAADLIQWYNDGADGAIDWGSEGDFDACVAVAGKYMDNPEGFCQLRHIDAVGGPAGSEGKKSADKYGDVISDSKGEPDDPDLYARVKSEAEKKFDVYPSAVANGWVVQEYKRRGGTYSISKATDTFTPPQTVQAAAQRALGWLKESKQGDGFTDTGRKRASDLAAGHAVSLDTVKRMKAYFDRHQPDQKAEGFESGEEGYPSAGRVAWDAWGGDAGYAWAESIVARNS